MKTQPAYAMISRRDRLIREQEHDPYKLSTKLPEPTVCPLCFAVYRKGRWTWEKPVPMDSHSVACQACQRIRDDYPAGEVLVTGGFALEHRVELLTLARHEEEAEKAHHPMHRIMDIEELDDIIVLRTTDVHLPHRIGHALERAWNGDLKIHYDEEGCFAAVRWSREKAHSKTKTRHGG